MNTLNNKNTHNPLVFKDFRYLPILLLFQIGTYFLLFRQFRSEDNSIFIPCLLLAFWIFLSFIFRKGTTFLQLCFLIVASIILGIFSLLFVGLLLPAKSPVIYLVLGSELQALIVFGILLSFRVKGLFKSTPCFLFALCTWATHLLPEFFFFGIKAIESVPNY